MPTSWLALSPEGDKMASDLYPPIPENQPGVRWYNDGRFITTLVMIVLAAVMPTINSCAASFNAKQAEGHAAAASVQSAENANKVDEVVGKMGVLEKKADAIQMKVDK
jgi:hypothetical protein